MEANNQVQPVVKPMSAPTAKPTPVAPPLAGEEKDKKKAALPIIIAVVIIGSGILFGRFLARRGSGEQGLTSKKLNGEVEMVSSSKEVGIKDERVFRDTAEGRMETNDFSKVREGSHKLIRPGGESQVAYLTSSVVDLNQFIGQCVQIWGETFQGQEAGWLMDVGRVKVSSECPEGV